MNTLLEAMGPQATQSKLAVSAFYVTCLTVNDTHLLNTPASESG